MASEKQPVQWDKIPEDPTREPFILLVEGEAGVGKTHLGLTFPEPIFILDTENRAEKVAAKFRRGKEVYHRRCMTFDDIRQTVTQLIFGKFLSGTVMIDSGSDLQSYAETEFLKENRKEKVWPQVLWGEVHAKTDNLLAILREKGFYCVVTGRLKDEYIDDGVRTGNLKLEGYKKMPHRADIYMRLTYAGKAEIIKNGLRNTQTEEIKELEKPSFESIVDELIKPNKLRRPDNNGPRWSESGSEGAEEAAEDTRLADGSAGQEEAPPEPERTTEAEPDRPATKQEISKAFEVAKELNLETGTLKMLLSDLRGRPVTDGMTVFEISDWVEAMKQIAVEYGTTVAE